ncbi:type II and III secretion system protein [Zoogloea sp.]|uniref:type II and III secretion system protein n=1 Tax=Zoogloea sp. TaxID=49181 RepID=UPI0035AED359
MPLRSRLFLVSVVLLAACTSMPPRQDTGAHLGRSVTPPLTGAMTALPPTPAPSQKAAAGTKPETYSVVVTSVRVQDLLFALARDAHVNIDIHPGLSGTVTLNAIKQTLPQLLTRIARQVDMRFELDGETLLVMPDTPYLHHYRLDYLNLSRSMSGTVSTNTQIATSATGISQTGANTTPAPSLAGGGNVSTTRIENISRNQFWESVEKNIRDLLHETDKVLPQGSSDTLIESSETSTTSGTTVLSTSAAAGARNRGAALSSSRAGVRPATGGAPTASQNSSTTLVHKSTFREAASVVAHRESGVLSVRATGRQHEKVREFIDQVMSAARRQVLIEATILEVSLSDTFRQGIEWSRVLASGTRFGITGPSLGSSAGNTVTPFSATFSSAGGIDATVKLLEGFGTVKVLSSPKLSVLNNQTAALKVVEEYVYFNVKADTTQTTNAGALTTVSTTPQAVSVGLVMSVTAQVGESDEVILNVRPTISSISDFRRDPNPNIPAGIANLVPQIRTREIESILRIANGETAILGGLMEDRIDYKTGRIPLAGGIPLLGELFTNRDNGIQKTELVIFLRPIVMHGPSMLAEANHLQRLLPDADFLRESPRPGERNFPEPPVLTPANQPARP